MAVSEERIDRRFALIATDGDVLYPVKKSQKSTGRFGFALSAPGEQDRQGGGTYTMDLEDVIRHVIHGGGLVRVTTTGKAGGERAGSLGVGKRSICAYWVSPELRHLVVGAELQPVDELPSNR